ncbi:MAG: 6-phosphogluconolactonase [Actinomycetota bacterium]|nr:6-phosphogluconolactonase [Actinomycetota bacterium]
MSTAEVVVHRDATLLARAVAARLVTRLVDAQAARGHAHLVLTGGGMGVGVLAELASSAARDAIDWPHLDVWWGDERFVPAGHPDRNDVAARAALLDHVPVDPSRVHPMPSSDGPDGDDPEAAAARYAADLARAAAPEDRDLVPAFDVLMLGVGEDGHVASLFPGLPALFDTRRAVAVRGAPKPPPVRVTMTFPSIRAAQEVWLITSGAAKAAVVSLALSGVGEVEIPAAGARGRHRTLWLLDEAAASLLPRALSRIASP